MAKETDASRYTFAISDADLGRDTWVQVAGGGLDQPIEIKFRLRGERLEITGLRIDNDHPVTSSTLRFRIAELAEQLGPFLRSLAASLVSDDDRRFAERFEQAGRPFETSRKLGYDPEQDRYEEVSWAMHLSDGLSRWMLELADDGELSPRGRGSKPPTDAEFKAFARVYLEEVQTRQRGAKARTAKRLHMDRGTVYRWITTCRERGFLPEEPTP